MGKKKHINKLLKIGVPAALLITAAFFVPWMVLRVWLSPLPVTVEDQVDKALSYGLDGIVVYVDQGDKGPAVYAAGWKDREKKIPADAQALFKIGSISKLYIAAAASKLINNSGLSPDDTLAVLLPELADRIENSDKITLRMLLQHRSGIPDWIEDPDFPWDKSLTDVSQVLETVLDDPAVFEPDSRYDYSNTNYLLIGLILDKTLGYSHHRFIKEEITAPLGLSHTYGLLGDVDPAMVFSGYDSHYEVDVKLLDFVSPGGSMVATARDVGIFLRALNDGSLLSREEQEIYSSIYVYEHTGLLPGYQSRATYHKDIDSVVIQFVNTTGGDTWTIAGIIYNRIVKILGRKTRSSG